MTQENDCDEYYQQRTDEIVGWMEHELKLAVERDKYFVNLLKVQVQRRTERPGRMEQLIRDTIDETMDELEENSELVKSSTCRVREQLSRCVEGIRKGDDCGDADDENELAALMDENTRLADLVKKRRENLDEILENNRYNETKLDRKKRENDRLRDNAIGTAQTDNSNQSNCND